MLYHWATETLVVIVTLLGGMFNVSYFHFYLKQGPPGTGKSFVGKALLHLLLSMEVPKHGPILVIISGFWLYFRDHLLFIKRGGHGEKMGILVTLKSGILKMMTQSSFHPSFPTNPTIHPSIQHSLIDSSIHPPIHPTILPPTHFFIHPPSFIHSVHPFVHPFIHSFIHSSIHSFNKVRLLLFLFSLDCYLQESFPWWIFGELSEAKSWI